VSDVRAAPRGLALPERQNASPFLVTIIIMIAFLTHTPFPAPQTS
jgi:hypothetical protein